MSARFLDVERLLDELIAMTGESKTEAVRKALAERQQRLILQIGPQPTLRLAPGEASRPALNRRESI